MEKIIISLCFSLFLGIILPLSSLKMIQILQLSSYRVKGVLDWFKRTKFDYIARYFSLFFFSFIMMLMFCVSFPDSIIKYFGFIFFISLSLFFIISQSKIKQKIALKFTKRVIRLLLLLFILYFLLSFAIIYFTFNHIFGYSFSAFLALFIPIIVIFAHFIMLPIEKLVNLYYFKKAKKNISNSSAIRIGITGSYGKTTAKNILATILRKKYRVLASPSSYNTPMGLCKLINGNESDYDVLIAEMGARHTGDIKELCLLVNPQYAIITTIGTQHLETFKTVENILKTKLELAENAETTIINCDDSLLMKGVSQYFPDKKGFLYSGQNPDSNIDALFSDISVSKSGTAFKLNLNGEILDIKTRLLGRHIPTLFSQCALLASVLGVSNNQIIESASELEQIPHRLQLIETERGVVIDDAFNSNPLGARNALEVLGMFDGNRVVITPGFIELGEIEKKENSKLGEIIKDYADYLISVKNEDIFNASKKSGMENCFLVDSLSEAINQLQKLNLDNSVILFLNDLPDNF